jgi:hypothetical protein
MDVAGRDRPHAEVGREVPEGRVPACVPACVRALELHEEAVPAEGPRQARGRVRIANGEPAAGAAGEADEALVQPGQQFRVEPRVQPLSCVSLGQEPAEVRVAAGRLDEERDVRPVGERRLGAGDPAHAEVLRRVCELERTVDPVVVGQRDRRVVELGCADGELLRKRRPVEERVGAVAVELDVAHGLAP